MRTASKGKKHSIVEAQSQFRHPRQHGLQLDTAHNVTAHYTTICIHLNKPHREVSKLNEVLSREKKVKYITKYIE